MHVAIFCAAYNTSEQQWSRLLDSVEAQTHQNWTLYVVHDGVIAPPWLQDSARVLIGRRKHCGIIGAVKRAAATWAAESRPDVLLELDHDDELTPDCLADICAAFHAHSACGFAYTDCAEVMPDGSPALYNDGWGMGHGSYRWENVALPAPSVASRWLAVTNYPPTNEFTVRDIVGMPNHARAWRTQTYLDVGGHDENLAQGDDYDLMLRTLIATPFVHVCTLGYLQHLSVGSATDVRRGAIRAVVPRIHSRYAAELERIDWSSHVTRQHPPWGSPARAKLLDLGGGKTGYPGFESIDLQLGDDVRFGITLPDDSIDVIRASHVLEHFDPCASWCVRHVVENSVSGLCVVGVMNELHRVLKPNGTLHLVVPSADGSGGVSDPTHRNFWNLRTIGYYAGALRDFLPQARPWHLLDVREYESYVKVIEAHLARG